MTRFADPAFLLLLLVLIPMVHYYTKRGSRVKFSTLTQLKKAASGARPINPRHILMVLRTVVVVCFVLALARPQAGKQYSEINSEGVDIMLVLDTSGSMRAMDFMIEKERVTRLEIIKKVVTEFIDKRPSDRMGMVVFGTDAFTQCPLTLDHGILMDFLKRLEVGMAGDATAIGSAVGTAVKRMKDLKAKSKVIVLVTDGESNAGQIPPLKSAEIAKTFGIKIYSIGVGTRGKAPIQVDSLFGKTFVYQDFQIDEDTLSKIANETGGKYYRATSSDELAKIYEEIDALEKTEIKVKEYTEYNELFHYFLLAGLLALLLEVVLGHTRFRKIP